MSNFSLNLLPYTLKTPIFSILEPEDSLKLLKTNQALRHHVLNHGPFPRNFTALKIKASGVEITDGMVASDEMSIELDSNSKTYRFLVSEHRQALDESGLIRITRQDLRLFEKIRNVQVIDLMLSDFPQSPHRLSIDVAKLMSQFRFTCVLLLTTAKIAYLRAILPHLSLKVERDLWLISRTKNKNPDMLGGLEICEFISNHLTDCKGITLIRIGEIGKDPSVYAALQKTNLLGLRLEFAKNVHFWEAVERFLKDGAPSRNREARLALTGSMDGVETNLEYPPEIKKFLQRYTVRVDDLEVIWGLLDELATDGHEFTMFRRVLPENLQIFYIFGLYDGRPWFRAKVKPILEAFP